MDDQIIQGLIESWFTPRLIRKHGFKNLKGTWLHISVRAIPLSENSVRTLKKVVY